MIIINAPIYFKGIWSIVKYWIDKKTRDKIKIYSSSKLKIIKEERYI